MVVTADNLYKVIDFVMALGYIIQIHNDFFRRKVFKVFTEDGVEVTSFREGDKVEVVGNRIKVYKSE